MNYMKQRLLCFVLPGALAKKAVAGGNTALSGGLLAGREILGAEQGRQRLLERLSPDSPAGSALKGRPCRSGTGNPALPVSQHNLSVGSKIHKQRDLLPFIHTAGKHSRRDSTAQPTFSPESALRPTPVRPGICADR